MNDNTGYRNTKNWVVGKHTHHTHCTHFFKNTHSRGIPLLSALERGRTSRGGSTNSSMNNSPSSRARTPPTNNRSSMLRQLSDDNDTDDDATLCQLTDDEADEATSYDAADASDFP